MSQSLTEKADVAEINRLHGDLASAYRNSLAKAIRIGELLASAKERLKHGEWGDWLKSCIPFSERTAQTYISYFERRADLTAAKVESIGEAYKLLKAPPEAPVKSATVAGTFLDNQPVTDEKQPDANTSSSSSSSEIIDLDDTGYPVPKSVLSIWQRRGDIDDILAHLKAVKLRLEKAMTDGDKLFIEANPTGSVSDVTRLATTIACGRPFAVCTQCQGHPEIQPKGGCTLCKGKGFISKFKWQTVPENLKKIREKMGKK